MIALVEAGRLGGGPGLARDDDRDRVREASDIVEVVAESVSLRPKGREFVGLCPFHEDHRPSMCVVPGKQIFHCFSCGAGGDVFTFVQRFHSMEFREALGFLAERAGIELTPMRAGEVREESVGIGRKDLLGVNTMARDFFRMILGHEVHGRSAREVVSRRGISAEMVERFELGAAPDRNDGLMLMSRERDVSNELLAHAGLTKERKSGLGDAFRNRLIFPIHDQIGRVTAFGARRIDDQDIPKYLNSPESVVFNKSATLYGLHQASRAIQRERVAVVTEGYTDVIACHQAGFENVVATLGTALTQDHARTLRRLCDTVVLLFDSDEAGAKAADRAAEVLFAQPIDVRIASLGGDGGGTDPDEILRTPNGKDRFARAIAGGVDLLEYRYARLREKIAGQGIAAQQRALEEEVGRLGELGLRRVDPTRRQFVIRRLSEITGLGSDVIGAALRAGGGGRSGPRRDAVDEPKAESGPLETALGCVLSDPSLLDDTMRRAMRSEAYAWGTMRGVVVAMREVLDGGEAPSLSNVLGHVSDSETSSRVVVLHRRAEASCMGDDDKRQRLYGDCVRAWQRQDAGTDTGDIIQRLASTQERYSTLGADPRALPRDGRAAGGDGR